MNKLTRATLIGTIAQIAMVVAGHYVPAVAGLFAIGGMGLSAIAGWLALKGQPASLTAAAGGGALVGGISAAIGIAVSVALGDVPPSLLLMGTSASAVTGLIGGLIGRRRG
ncbi:hypothetical protein [Sandarakinorhabdus sp.]|uniref:hypothetical protein n=1 Tax=Sandarakinorhabdus sp. TaxID=1916663 RepID=UPI00286E0A4B|nr:hypothetical protein [Sandarakinorhabdus sp.]